MDRNKLTQLITNYSNDFEINWANENYKWVELNRFSQNWNIDETDLSNMLEKSINISSNLFVSKNYYPINEILNLVKIDEDRIRTLLKILLDEKEDLDERIELYSSGIKQIKQNNNVENSDGEDLRFISTLLWMVYPEKYSIYKYTENRDFANYFNTGIKIKKGLPKSISLVSNLVDVVAFEVDNKYPNLKSKYLQKLNDNDFYYDISLRLLAQNIMWYAQKYQNETIKDILTMPEITTNKIFKSSFRPNIDHANINVDYLSRYNSNKNLGLTGESYVISLENQNMKSYGLNLEPDWVSKNIGDGLGYDVLSYDENGRKLYIEVKTTNGNADTTFFITANELEAAKRYKEQYRLYRLYDFNNEPKLQIYLWKEVIEICNTPYVYVISS